MIRLLLYFAMIAAAATGLAWVADRPGTLTVQWLGYDIQTSVFIAAIVLVVVFITLVLAIWLGVLTVTAPRRFARRLARRRQRIGQAAVRRGIFAAGAGDRVEASKAGAIAKKNVPDEPLALLLEAQSAQLNEDAIGSRQAFERMLEKPEMAELGLRGLYIEAKKAGQLSAARQFAERALAANPALGWSSSALFEMQCREGDWRGALRTLGIAKQNRHLPRHEADRRRAVLLTQLAIDLEETHPTKALAYAQEAFALSPNLVPAATVAGRLLAAQGSAARATKLLSQAWRTTQHPDLALVYAHARTGDSPRDRLARVKALVAAGPSSLEGDLAVAVAAIEASDWTAARLALEPHLADTPPARVCRLMARIEAGQNRDAGRAREWLAKAGRGAPDPIWVAADGSLSTEWHAMPAGSDTLGTFEWKTPPAATAEGGDDIMAEMSALDVSVVGTDELPETVATPEAMAASTSIAPASNSPAPKSAAAAAQSAPEPSNRKNRSGTDDEAQDRGDREGMKQISSMAVETSNPTASKVAGANKSKEEGRKLTIFVSGPAPDDPGPRTGESEDGGTLLSRFRGPS